jgi:D-glycero-alpha-D-manno-heptose 1-phosphate guanylyltransferase
MAMEAVQPIGAIILAGGLGTRLRSTVSHVPKVLADVAGRPFLEYLLLQLSRAGICDVTLCAGFMSDALADWAARRDADDGITIRISVEPEPLGTAGAVKHAEPMLAGDRWLLMNGDSFFDISLDRLVEAHEQRPALVTIALAHVADARRYGRVRCDPDGLVLGFDEKTDAPGDGLINSGLYIIERPLLAQIPADRPASLEREVLPLLAGRELRAVELDGYFIDIGIPEDYALAQERADVLGRVSSG